jgi:hypothetical protein
MKWANGHFRKKGLGLPLDEKLSWFAALARTLETIRPRQIVSAAGVSLGLVAYAHITEVICSAAARDRERDRTAARLRDEDSGGTR